MIRGYLKSRNYGLSLQSMTATALKNVFALYLSIACGKFFNFFVFRNALKQKTLSGWMIPTRKRFFMMYGG